MLGLKLRNSFLIARGGFTRFKMNAHSNSKIVAVCQMNVGEDKAKNLNVCEDLIKSAKSQNAAMVFLPEGCDFICANTADIIKNAEPEDGFLVTEYKALARKYNVWLSIGGIHLKFSEEKTSNVHLIINNAGDIVSKYHKIHTFDVELTNQVVSESSFVEKGKNIIPPVPSPVGNIGLAVCYDVRFPEIGIALTEMGAEILTYPSAFFFETGSVHWETLLRCRAIENQCYVIAAAQTGCPFPNRKLWGHAMIVDPRGTICAQCSEGSQIAISTINLELLKEVRSNMPLLKQKRYDLYPRIANISRFGEETSYQFGQVTINAKTVFFKTNLTLAFVNKKCAVPGHVLVVPVRVTPRFSDLSALEIADLFQTVQKVQRVMEKVHSTESSTIVIQDGPDAGQTIFHVHVHILPRKPNDFPDNDDVYRVLQNHDKNVSVWREEEEMIEEADHLRKFFLSLD